MKTQNEVIEFIKSELECNNTLVIATLGNGGAGLSLIQTQVEQEISSLVEDIENAGFDGSVEPSEDIARCEFYSDECEVYQFSDGNGLKTQVMTY